MSAPTTIDLSAVPLPAAIETFSAQALQDAFTARFVAAWEEERAADPTLPAFTIGALHGNPVAVARRAFSALRILDRQRVNDALRALFVTTAGGDNLAALVARQDVERLVAVPATPDAPAVIESDASLLNRYLLSFDRGSAGSAGLYLYEARTAWPSGVDLAGNPVGLGDVRVNGFEVHGRRGDTDIVIIGPAGRLPTPAERARVASACLAPHVKPEAVSAAVIVARRAEYAVRLRIEIPHGPDAELVRGEVERTIVAAGAARRLIGGEIPPGFFRGIAYGNANVIASEDLAPVVVPPDSYAVPVMTAVQVEPVVRP